MYVKSSKNNRLLLYVAGLLFAFIYGFTFLLPLFVLHLGGTEFNAGILFGVYGLGCLTAILLCKHFFTILPVKVILITAALIYMLASLGLAVAQQLSPLILVFIALQGIGWGLYYNAAPYLLSYLTQPSTRVTSFNYWTATTVLGSCLAPGAVHFSFHGSLMFNHMFLCGAILSGLVAILFAGLNVEPDKTKPKTTPLTKVPGVTYYPLFMVFLGACIVSVVLNFQTSFALETNLNYANFYLIYSFTVVGARILLGQFLARYNQYHLIIFFTCCMTLAVFTFPFSDNSFRLYLFSSCLFAFGYGLLYPALQAVLVNQSSEAMRAQNISYFSLLYFLGLYLFPILAGWLIVHIGYRNTFIIMGTVAFCEFVLSILLYKTINSKSTLEYQNN